MTMSTNSTMSARIHRKGFRIPSKRQPGKGLPGKLHTITRVSQDIHICYIYLVKIIIFDKKKDNKESSTRGSSPIRYPVAGR